ncbi:MAG TPA: type II secretion system protein GspC [Myxococcota bacterium]
MLETLFRKRFFVVHLVLTALLAIVLARTTTSIVARVLVDKLNASAAANTPKPVATRPTTTTRDFTALVNANIFEGRREVVIPSAGGGNTGPAPSSGDNGEWWNAPKSGLRLRLVGTMAFSNTAFSLATIVDESQSGAAGQLHAIADCADVDTSSMSPEDAKLVGRPAPCNRIGDVALLKRVEPERVYIWNTSDSRIEYLALNEPPNPAGAPPPRVARADAPPEKPDDGDGGITKTGDNSYGVARSTVDDALNNLSSLATQARVVPAFEGGKPVGFKLFSIKPGSLYSKIGLQNGDVINRINGYELDSPEKGLEVYAKLKDSTAVTVEVKRRGKPMTMSYNIQ